MEEVTLFGIPDVTKKPAAKPPKGKRKTSAVAAAPAPPPIVEEEDEAHEEPVVAADSVQTASAPATKRAIATADPALIGTSGRILGGQYRHKVTGVEGSRVVTACANSFRARLWTNRTDRPPCPGCVAALKEA